MHEDKGARSGGAMQERGWRGREELWMGRSRGRQAARMKPEAHTAFYQKRKMVSIVSKQIIILSIRIVNSKRAVAFERVNLAAEQETALGPTSPLLAGAKNGAPGKRAFAAARRPARRASQRFSTA